MISITICSLLRLIPVDGDLARIACISTSLDETHVMGEIQNHAKPCNDRRPARMPRAPLLVTITELLLLILIVLEP